jgi:hypothetical protein
MISRTRAATAGLLVPAALALGMSANTSYRFLGTALQITDHVERLALCGVAEAAIVALTIYSWATRTRGAAWLAYAVVLAQAVPAFQVGGATGGTIRVALGPVLLAVLLHLLLGLELRMAGAQSDSIASAALREVRERLTARLGIGRRGADSAAIARSRAADRAVDLADRSDLSRSVRSRAKNRARLAAAIDAARHDLAPAEADAAEAEIVARVVRRKSVDSLSGIGMRHDWSAALYEQMQGSELPQPEGTVNRLLEARRRLMWGIHPAMPPKPAGGDVQAEEFEHDQEDDQEAGDVTDYAAALLGHEPPPWTDLSLRQAVAKADEILPGMSSVLLAQVLAEVGVHTTDASVRSTRSSLRRAQTVSQR